MHRLIGLFVISTTICGCATAPLTKQQVTTELPLQVIKASEEPSSEVANILAEFKKAKNEQRLQQSLIALAERYQSQTHCQASDKVIKYALPLLADHELLAKANIIRSECVILSLEELQNSEPLVEYPSILPSRVNMDLVSLLSAWLSNVDANSINENWQARHQAVLAYIQAKQGNYKSALNKMLPSESSSSVLGPLLPQLIFNWLASLNYDERMALIESHPQLFRYQRLLSIIEDESINDAQRQRQLTSLIEKARTAGEFSRLPAHVRLFLSKNINKQQKTAVLLPLSGRLASQGEAIKQGILASYYEQLSRQEKGSAFNSINTNDVVENRTQFVFIDTGSESELPETINAETMRGYSEVIGPLLKTHIDASQAIMSEQTLRIYLNQLDANTLSTADKAIDSTSLVNFFALSPEQEAQELAKQMLAQNIQHPVLIHDDSAVTMRMVDAFLATWQEQEQSNSEIAPSKVRYTDNKSMRVGITSALDVLQSQQRINQLSNLVNETVFSVTRNRRDVDAFVVFARPNEVELINPIIESSMSLFTAEQIPVYATSLSYNHKQNKNSLRDLRNLVFVDMPFILPDGRETALATEVDTLFNQPSSTYLRLFAFGYDAVALSQQIVKLRAFNQISIQGLSGSLSLDSNGNVERKLSTLSIEAGN